MENLRDSYDENSEDNSDHEPEQDLETMSQDIFDCSGRLDGHDEDFSTDLNYQKALYDEFKFQMVQQLEPNEVFKSVVTMFENCSGHIGMDLKTYNALRYNENLNAKELLAILEKCARDFIDGRSELEGPALRRFNVHLMAITVQTQDILNENQPDNEEEYKEPLESIMMILCNQLIQYDHDWTEFNRLEHKVLKDTIYNFENVADLLKNYLSDDVINHLLQIN